MGEGPSRLERIDVVGRADLAPPAPRWDESLLLGEVLEPVTLETTAGSTVVGRGQGRVTVLAFLFTSCPVPEFCPLLVTKLAALQHRIGSGRIITVTIDPEHDTLERLAAYGTGVGADPAIWSFGRLAPDPLKQLLARVDVDVRPEGGTLTHDLRLLVLDAEGRLVYREHDNDWDVDTLEKEVLAATPPRPAPP
jgi:protein SCO1/2